MEIAKLEIEGFRSFKKTTWQPGKLNVIIGRNASGKSNLLQLLELLSFSASGNLNSYVASRGGWPELAWNGQADCICINGLFQGPTGFDVIPTTQYDYTLALEPAANSSLHQIKRENLSYSEISGGKAIRVFERSAQQATLFKNGTTSQTDNFLEPETLLSSLSNPLVARDVPQALTVNKALKDWRIYQDIRTDRYAEIRQGAEFTTKSQLLTNGQNLTGVLYNLYQDSGDSDFKERLDDAMWVAFDKQYEGLEFFRSNGRTELGIKWRGVERLSSLAETSEGTLRFLLLATLLLSPEPPSLIAIDEPETGLHPFMLPVIAGLADNAALRSQIIFTTHSSELLSSFDKDADLTVTAATWLDGQTVLANLNGEVLSYWRQTSPLGELFVSNQLENLTEDVLERVS